jgi:molybdate transport repressor ModE-like protein
MLRRVANPRNVQVCKLVFDLRKMLAMFDPRDLDDLVAIRRAGSLSGAAKRRGVAVSTVSRRIEALERALKLPLIDRRVGGSTLTRQGAEIAALAEPLADQLARVERAAQSLGAGAERLPVRVTATEFIVSDILAPALPGLRGDKGGFPVHLQSQGELVSLAGRDADIAIRMSRPEGASLYCRRLPEIRLALFASPGYLGGRDPAALDLRAERLITYDATYGRIPETAWIEAAGLGDAVVLRTGSSRAQLIAAREGVGIALLSTVFAAREGLIELPQDPGIAPRVPWLAVHRDLRREPAIKAVQAWIVVAFAVLRESPSPL